MQNSLHPLSTSLIIARSLLDFWIIVRLFKQKGNKNVYTYLPTVKFSSRTGGKARKSDNPEIQKTADSRLNKAFAYNIDIEMHT